MKVFKVISWDTDEVLTEVTDLAIAKKHCRSMGHTGEHNGKWFMPVARVQNDKGECVYNPRFRVKT